MNLKEAKLRLFALRDLRTGRLVPDATFPDKPSAKRERELRGRDHYCVTYGPDHRHFKPTH